MSEEKIHPIETLRDGAELVRVLERVATAMELTEHRQSRLDDLLVGGWTNDVLYSGCILLGSSGLAQLSFRAPFAAVTLSDPDGNGPLLAVNDQSGDFTESIGAGRWLVAVNGSETFAMTGTSLTIATLSGAPKSPAYAYLTVWTKFPGLR